MSKIAARQNIGGIARSSGDAKMVGLYG